jgi:hypothetical protein
MAKRRTRSSSAIQVFRAPRPQAPVIRIAAPRMVASGKKRKGKRRHGGSSASSGGGKDVLIKLAIGGAAVGYAEKAGWLAKVPSIPLLGTKGSFAVGGYMLGFTKKPGLLRDAVLAAAVLAGHELGHDGKITGDD